jgi:peptidyl-prolyl cis-trans isomerase C
MSPHPGASCSKFDESTKFCLGVSEKGYENLSMFNELVVLVGYNPGLVQGVVAMKTSFFKNPVVHVLILGLLLAVVLVILKGPASSIDEMRRVVITDSDIAQLRMGWLRTWQREPTQAEMSGLLEKFLREEVFYREAVLRGYDQNDAVVRRALAQKMEFLAETQVTQQQPTEDEIEAYYTLRRERYRVPAKISFGQIFFNADKRGQSALSDARKLLVELQGRELSPGEASVQGDQSMLRTQYVNLTEQQVRSQFGEEFASSVISFEPGKWMGPVRSGYGYHLVYLSDRDDGELPDWRLVKEKILGDMVFEAKAAAREQFFQEILRQFQVVLEGDVEQAVEDTGE